MHLLLWETGQYAVWSEHEIRRFSRTQQYAELKRYSCNEYVPRSAFAYTLRTFQSMKNTGASDLTVRANEEGRELRLYECNSQMVPAVSIPAIVGIVR